MKKGNLRETYNAAFCEIHSGVKFKLPLSVGHISLQNQKIFRTFVNVYIRASREFFWAPPCATETPQHSAGPLRWQKEPKCQKKDRRRGAGEGREGWGWTLGFLVRGGICKGGAARSESVSASLIWSEFIHAEELETHAERQQWYAQITHRWEEKTDRGNIWMCVECRWFVTEEVS